MANRRSTVRLYPAGTVQRDTISLSVCVIDVISKLGLEIKVPLEESLSVIRYKIKQQTGCGQPTSSGNGGFGGTTKALYKHHRLPATSVT